MENCGFVKMNGERMKEERMIKMLDLNKYMFSEEDREIAPFSWNVLVGQDGYLCYQESSEGGIDYTLLDGSLDEIDCGVFMYGTYNEKKDDWDIPEGYKGYTYKEFFEMLKEDYDVTFNENSIPVLREELVNAIWAFII